LFVYYTSCKLRSTPKKTGILIAIAPRVTKIFVMRKLIIIGLFSILLPNLQAQNEQQKVQEADDFSLPNAANTINGVGMEVSLSDYNNVKGYIVVFTSNICPHSQAYEERVIALHQKYAMQGYPVIAINPNRGDINPGESFDQMKLRAKEKNYPFAYLQDTTQSIAMRLGAEYTTQAFVIQKKADKNIVRYVGAIDDNTWESSKVSLRYVADAVDSLLKSELPNLKFAQTQGCQILWKKEFAAVFSSADILSTKRRKGN